MTESASRTDPRTQNARRLRKGATTSEKRLWAILRQLDVPGHFRRQVPMGPYFADFAHLGFRLVVELDGESHSFEGQQQHDDQRTQFLKVSGFRVIRFWNDEVMRNRDGVVETILAALRNNPVFRDYEAKSGFSSGYAALSDCQIQSPPTPSPSPPFHGRRGTERGASPSRVNEREKASTGASPPPACGGEG